MHKIAMITNKYQLSDCQRDGTSTDGDPFVAIGSNNVGSNSRSSTSTVHQQHQQQTTTICHNNRLKHTIFLLITIILFICSPVASDLTAEPPDCTGIVCNQKCPSDSELIRIDSYDASILTTSSPLMLNDTKIATATTTEPSALRRKRAIPLTYQRRESIKIVPGGYIRRRRDASIGDNHIIGASSTSPEPIHVPSSHEQQQQRRQTECCSPDRVQCKCNYAKCKDIECLPLQYKIAIAHATGVPGNCCPRYMCSAQKPTCYSQNLKRTFNPFEQWDEDPCTHCECSENGENLCNISMCKPMSCEKKVTIPGQCCPVCDISGSIYCQDHENCDVHCRNGLERDPIRGCLMCLCAKSNVTMSSSTTTTTAPAPATSTSSDIEDDIVNSSTVASIVPEESGGTGDFNQQIDTSSTKPIDKDDNWFVHMPIMLGICITVVAFTVVVSLTCRHMSHNKDKHHLNRKQNTPLI